MDSHGFVQTRSVPWIKEGLIGLERHLEGYRTVPGGIKPLSMFDSRAEGELKRRRRIMSSEEWKLLIPLCKHARPFLAVQEFDTRNGLGKAQIFQAH